MKYLSKFVIILILLTLTLQAADERKIMVRKSGGSALGIVVTESEATTGSSARIMEVLAGSEAGRIGLKADDVITSFDGQKISNLDDLQKATQGLDAEKDVKIEVLRGGSTLSFTAKIKPMKKEELEKQIQVSMSGDGDPMHISTGNKLVWVGEDGHKGGFLGVEARNISEEMKTYFEVKNGVLIEKVIEDTPAEKASLKAGDVIIEVSGRMIEDYADLVRTLKYYNPGEKVDVKYSRKGKVSTVKVELAEQKLMHEKIILNHPEAEMMFDGEDGDVKIMRLKDKMHEFQWQGEVEEKGTGTTITKKILVF